VALVGLFAMHGLAGHGMTHQMDMPGETSWAGAHAEHATGPAMSMTDGTDHYALAQRQPAKPAAPGPGPSSMTLIGLCLAVLVAGIAALLRGRLLEKVSRGVHTRLLAGRPARARRDHDPPCLLALSIQRC
jgi:hypothetical protein